MDIHTTPKWLVGRREIKLILHDSEIDRLKDLAELRNDEFSKQLRNLLKDK